MKSGYDTCKPHVPNETLRLSGISFQPIKHSYMYLAHANDSFRRPHLCYNGRQREMHTLVGAFPGGCAGNAPKTAATFPLEPGGSGCASYTLGLRACSPLQQTTWRA